MVGVRERVKMKLFDSHIHLIQYREQEIETICEDPQIEGIVAVSMNAEETTALIPWKEKYPDKIRLGAGYHPEQEIRDVELLFHWMKQHWTQLDLVGEVGLPYYLRREALRKGEAFDDKRYEDLLARFLQFSQDYQLPVALHAVRQDVNKVYDLLQDFQIPTIHFHWLKADRSILQLLANQGMYISFTPDIIYNQETREVAKYYPMDLILIETDGPWEYEGCFGQRTMPWIMERTIHELAFIRQLSVDQLVDQFHRNSNKCYPVRNKRKW